MNLPGIIINHLPELQKPILIAGFEGWGNAADLSIRMSQYLIKKFKAIAFAELNPDLFYRYDGPRPIVTIEEGTLINYTPPGGAFYYATTADGDRDIIILKCDEPNINWTLFSESLFSLCRQLKVTFLITLGSMFDRVLHTDRLISGIASDPELFFSSKFQNLRPISYKGPSAIHSILQYEGEQRGLKCVSLWSHCPFYIQSVHYGLLAHLGTLLGQLCEFEINVTDLEIKWQKQHKQFQTLIEKHPELQEAISDLQESAADDPFAEDSPPSPPPPKQPNIIHIRDFLDPK